MLREQNIVNILDRAGQQTAAFLTGEQLAQLAELQQILIGRCPVNISDAASSKWEEIWAASKLEGKVWQKPIWPSQKLKTVNEVPLFEWTDDLGRSQADRYAPHSQSCILAPHDVQ